MKLRSYAPAVIAVIALGVVYRWVSQRDDASSSPRAGSASQPVATTPATKTATPAAPTPLPPPPPSPALPGEGPSEAPRALTPAEYAGHEPKAKKAKMTLEEKLAAAKQHITVLERRVELIKQDIAVLEDKGDKAKASEQRIVMDRLNAHADKLRKAIAEGREPE